MSHTKVNLGEWEGGPDGMTVLAFGTHVDGDGNMQPGWWTA